MPRPRRLKKPPARATALATLPARAPSPVVRDLVLQLREGAWREFPELPDTVIQALATRAPSSRLAMHSAYRQWRAWGAQQSPRPEPFPADPAALARFLQDQSPPLRATAAGEFEMDAEARVSAAGLPVKTLATLSKIRSLLGALHRDAGLNDPFNDPQTRAVWRVLKRGLKRPTQKAGLTLETLTQALQQLPDTPLGHRDRAMAWMAYALMARRSELVALNVADVHWHADDGSAMVEFARHKTGLMASGYLPPPIASDLHHWLRSAGITEGALFRRLDFAGARHAARLKPQAVARIFKRIAELAQLPNLLPQHISGHSARIGATQDLIRAGASDAAIMRDGGWKTPAMVALYGRNAKAEQGAMANLLRSALKA